jgi:2-polyprenyl-6-methoxyphenol hydroxylase-like FAD-dependent oxidoreductase
MSDKSIAVIGGGIGGVSAALHLLRAGFDVQVYEQSRALREVGAGINVTPNATRVVHNLGLGDQLARLGVMPLAVHQQRWDDGRTLLRTPLGTDIAAHFGYPQYQSHRADVLNMLVGALPRERMHLGHRLMEFNERGGKVEALFENGARVTADALIGADGIHSTVQRLLFGATAPRFTGCTAYRGLVPAEKLEHLDLEIALQIWMGPGKHLVVYYVAGKRLVNFVANIEQDSWTGESWTDRGEVKDLRAAFAGWDAKPRAVIGAVDETFIWGLFDRAPLERWSQGRVTLLGDACHPMLPYMAQGAAQAMEDGVTLSACLRKYDDVGEALARYQALRLPRTAYVQSLAANNKTRFHLPDGPEQAARDARMAAGGTDWSFKAMEWIYGHDPAAAVETGSLGLPVTA